MNNFFKESLILDGYLTEGGCYYEALQTAETDDPNYAIRIEREYDIMTDLRREEREEKQAKQEEDFALWIMEKAYLASKAYYESHGGIDL
jgi:cysteinyl-tRNA synthetase